MCPVPPRSFPGDARVEIRGMRACLLAFNQFDGLRFHASKIIGRDHGVVPIVVPNIKIIYGEELRGCPVDGLPILVPLISHILPLHPRVKLHPGTIANSSRKAWLLHNFGPQIFQDRVAQHARG